MKIVSFFAGAGGLDQGFEDAGFNIVWANDFNEKVQTTYERNHPNTTFILKSIEDISADEVPVCDGIIGGPPCQSWSVAGSHGGDNDPRGKLFWEYFRIISSKKPKFFLAENVKGILSKRHQKSFKHIKKLFRKAGYNIKVKLLQASDYGVAQDRERVFILGINKELKPTSSLFFPRARPNEHQTLEDVIGHLKYTKPIGTKKVAMCKDNHEYLEGSFSPHFKSRNRVRSWKQCSFTILAVGRHMVLHPQAPKMKKVEKDVCKFQEGKEHLYRRFSVKEAALIQSFPSDYRFYYDNINDGYKMVGNAVPPKLAFYIALQIKKKLGL